MNDVQEIFVAPDALLALENALQFQNGDLLATEFQPLRVFGFSVEVAEAINLKNEVHRRAVLKVSNGVGRHDAAHPRGNVLNAHVVAFRQVHP